MQDRWITALTNHSEKSSTTHLKPWSVSCVALWKSKGVKLKPTPICVRRNNPSSQQNSCSRDVGTGEGLPPRTSQSPAAGCRRIFRLQQNRPPISFALFDL